MTPSSGLGLLTTWLVLRPLSWEEAWCNWAMLSSCLLELSEVTRRKWENGVDVWTKWETVIPKRWHSRAARELNILEIPMNLCGRDSQRGLYEALRSKGQSGDTGQPL